MGQIGIDFEDLKESLQEIGEKNLIACFEPQEILQMCKNLGVKGELEDKIKEYILSEKGHIGGRSQDVHTMSLLFGSFFGKDLTYHHLNIMKSLQGFEVETLLVDKALDKPKEINDLDMRAIAGRIIYSAMTNKFFNSLAKLSLSEDKKFLAIQEWNKTLGHIYSGQGLDVIYGKNGQFLKLGDYLHMIKESTAKFIQLSLLLGALISDKNEKEVEQIKNYGVNLGIGFQIRDDFYDFENDIYEGKKRIFVTKEALRRLKQEDRYFIYNNYQKNPSRCIELIKNSEIPDFVKSVNNHYLDLAKIYLNSLGKDKCRKRLEEIAESLRI